MYHTYMKASVSKFWETVFNAYNLYILTKSESPLVVLVISLEGTKKSPCPYFLSGTCRFGDKCRNEHPTGGGNNVIFCYSVKD